MAHGTVAMCSGLRHAWWPPYVIWTASYVWQTSHITECKCGLALPKVETRTQFPVFPCGCRGQACYLDSAYPMPQYKNWICKRATWRAGTHGDTFWPEEQQNGCFWGEQWQSFWCIMPGVGGGHYGAAQGGLSDTILWWVVHWDVQLPSPTGPLRQSVCYLIAYNKFPFCLK